MTIATLENAAAAPADPFALFDEWMQDAVKSEPVDPNAMSLATVDADGKPSVRMVLLKALDATGFTFYTNRDSRKGNALKANPVAALCFHWKSLNRQIRIEGSVEIVDGLEADTYYNSRGRGSRLGAWASQQSRDLPNRTALASRVREYEEKFSRDEIIPRPSHWGGYRVKPDRIEFWHEGQSRLHTRVLYTRTKDGWDKKMLYP